MLYRLQRTDLPWDAVGRAAVLLIGVQVIAGWVLALGPGHTSRTIVGLVALAMVATLVVAARLRIPRAVKIGLIGIASITLLGWFGTEDALGLKAVSRTSLQALADADAHHTDRVRGVGTAHQLQSDVASVADPVLANTGIALEARVQEIRHDPYRSYRIDWALVRGDERLWCGAYSVSGTGRAELDMLRDRVAEAARRSQGGALRCD